MSSYDEPSYEESSHDKSDDGEPGYDELINGYFDDMLTDEQFAELSAWLCADSTHAERFMQVALLHSRIRDILQQEDLLGFLLADISDDMQGTIDPTNVLRLIEEDEAISKHRAKEAAARQARLDAEVAERQQRMLELAQRRAATTQVIEIPRVLGYLVVGTAAALLISLAYTLLPPVEERIATKEHIARIQPAPATIKAVPPVAEISNVSRDALWLKKDQSIQIGTALEAGQLALASGVVELTFSSGARIVAEAPVNLELLSADRVRVHSGKVVANVPEQALGFTIFSGAAAIVDLGTEFGVETDAEGSSSIHVLDGEVALVATPRNGKDTKPSQRLLAGSARKVSADGDQVDQIAYDKTTFIREIPASPYELAILRSRPLTYWRFNEPSGSVELNSMTSLNKTSEIDPSIQFGKDGRLLQAGNFAAYFTGDHEGINLENPGQFTFTKDFTLEAWVKPSFQVNTPQRIISTFAAEPGKNGQLEHVGFAFGIADRGFHVETDSTIPPIRLLFTFYGVCDCIGIVYLPPNRWVHIAASIGSDSKPTLYVNGAEIETRFVGSESNRKDWQWVPSFVGRASSVPCYLARNPTVPNPPYPSEAWQGGIDELAIFDRSLTPEEIRTHYQASLAK